MKRLFILFMLCAPLFGQTITAVSIDAGGWDAYVTISNFTDLGTLNFGLGANSSPVGANAVFTVTRPTDYGGSAGTVVDTVVGTKGVRYAWPVAWAATTAHALNDVVQDTSGNCPEGSGGANCEQKVVACSGTCTTGGSAPAWCTSTIPGCTTVDNSGGNQVTWKNENWIPNGGTAPVRLTSTDENIATAGSVKIRIALSDFIYSTDTVTVAIASGFYTDNGLGGTGNPSSALSAGTAVTNNSTLAYSTSKPLCRATWPGFERVTANFPVEVLCAGRFARNSSEVESVVFTATDQHSNSVSYTVTSMTKSIYNRSWTNSSVPYATGPGDAGGVTQVYTATINVSTLTQGDQITVTWLAYPWAGDSTAVFNSAVGQDGAAQPSENAGPLYYILDKTGAYGSAFAHVKSGGASSCGTHVFNTRAGAEGDSTGLNDMALAASCIEAYNNTNYSRADAGGGMILMDAGTAWGTGSAQHALGTMKTWLVVDKVSTLAQSQVVITSNANGMPDSDNNTLLKYQNITVSITTGIGIGYGSGTGTDSVWLHNLNLGGYTQSGGFGNMGGALYATQTYNAPNYCGCFYYGGGSARVPFELVRGNFVVSPSANSNRGAEYALISNYGLEPVEIDAANSASQGTSDNSIVAYNYWYNINDGGAGIGQETNLLKGSAWIQNVFEAGPNLGGTLSGQTSAVTVNNLIYHHNSIGTGGTTFGNVRVHACYDVTGTYSNPMNNWSWQWNNFAQYSIESDSSYAISAPSGLRVGNWPCLFNVGTLGTLQAGCSGCFSPEFYGLGWNGSQSTVTADPQYLNGSPGNGWYGSYNILNTSADIGIAPWTSTVNEVIPYDMLGAPRTCPSGIGCTAGAYMYGVGYVTVGAGSTIKNASFGIGQAAAAPTFSPGSGTYGTTQTVTISTTSGTVICYNTSGSPATNGLGTDCTNGTKYTGAVSVSSSETLYAVAGSARLGDSPVGSAAYTIGTPIGLVAHTYAVGNTSITTPAINTTGASLIVALFGTYFGNPCTALSVTDNKSNSYTSIQYYGVNSGGGGGNVCIWYKANPTVGSGHTFSASGGYMSLGVMAFSTVITTSPLDVQNGAGTGSSVSSISTGSVTPSQANDVCIAGGSEYGGDTSISMLSPLAAVTVLDSAPSAGGSNVGFGDGYVVQTSATTISTTYTISGSSSPAAAIACFKHS